MQENKYKRGFSWESDGTIWIEEYPKSPHEAASREFDRRLMANVPNLLSKGATGYTTAAWTMQPDESYVARNLANPGVGHPNAATLGGLPWPRVVLEVHYCTSLSNLYQRAARWLLPATQVQIVV